MKVILSILLLNFSLSALANGNVIHDDGTGAQISFCLATREKSDGRIVEYKTFRISVTKDEKFLLLADLTGKTSDDGKFFIGEIIIPSHFVDSAEILLLGGPPNSTLGVTKKMKVRDFKQIKRKKSWTEQE